MENTHTTAYLWLFTTAKWHSSLLALWNDGANHNPNYLFTF